MRNSSPQRPASQLRHGDSVIGSLEQVGASSLLAGGRPPCPLGHFQVMPGSHRCIWGCLSKKTSFQLAPEVFHTQQPRPLQRRATKTSSVWPSGWREDTLKRHLCPSIGNRTTETKDPRKLGFSWNLGERKVGNANGWHQLEGNPDLKEEIHTV